MKRCLVVLVVGAAALVPSGCEESSSSPPTVAAADFCDQLAATLCAADRDCCAQPAAGPDGDAGTDTGDAGEAGDARDAGDGGTGEDACLRAQRAACETVVLPLLVDPRLGYDGVKAGAYLEELSTGGGGCWDEPPAYDDFRALFGGTGAEGADCTPRDTTTAQLRIAALSCRSGTTCHLYLRADGSPFGVCERPADDSCSHAFDCPAGQRCNLPDAWEPGVWGVCQPLRADGWDCTGDLDCASQYCDPGRICSPPPASRFCLSTSYAATVLADDPVAYWRLGERTGSTAEDFSGNGHPARYQGGVARGRTGALATDPDSAITLDDPAEYVVAEDTPALDVGDALSLECWFNRNEVTTARPILEYNNAAGTALGPQIWNFDTGDKLYANFMDAEGVGHEITTDVGAVAADTWYHVVATYDGSIGRLFLDGTEVGTVEGAFTLRTGPMFFVGYRPSVDDNFQGGLDEVAVYDHALTAARIRVHHDVGTTGPAPNEWVLFRWLR